MTLGPATSSNRSNPEWRRRTGFDNVQTEPEIRAEQRGTMARDFTSRPVEIDFDPMPLIGVLGPKRDWYVPTIEENDGVPEGCGLIIGAGETKAAFVNVDFRKKRGIA